MSITTEQVKIDHNLLTLPIKFLVSSSFFQKNLKKNDINYLNRSNTHMERLVNSFVNYTFTVGEWLIDKGALTKELIQEMDGEVIIGIPSLAVLNCIEGTSQFEDNQVHLATGAVISPDTPGLNETVKELLAKILLGATMYRQIDFNYKTYEKFKLDTMRSLNDNTVEFEGELQKQLHQIIYGIGLKITQIREYKNNYNNVISLLETICPESPELPESPESPELPE